MSDNMKNDIAVTETVTHVKKRESVHLPWYKTQYWSGFIFGLEFGLLAGLPVAFVIYQVAKVVVNFIEGV